MYSHLIVFCSSAKCGVNCVLHFAYVNWHLMRTVDDNCMVSTSIQFDTMSFVNREHHLRCISCYPHRSSSLYMPFKINNLTVQS